MLGTDPLVLEFQASVNKPFMALSALWKVSAQVVSGRCSHTRSHHLFIESCAADTQALQMPANPFPSSGLPRLPLSALHILRSPFGLFLFPSKQKRPPGVLMHPGAREGGAAETFPCVPVTNRLGISCHTPSLHCDSLGGFVPAVLWQHPGWREPQLCPWWTASPSPPPPPLPTRLKAPLGSWASL